MKSTCSMPRTLWQPGCNLRDCCFEYSLQAGSCLTLSDAQQEWEMPAEKFAALPKKRKSLVSSIPLNMPVNSQALSMP